MTPKKYLIAFAALLLVVIAFAFTRATDDPITKIITQLNKWAELNRREKVYLHLDKPYYAAGESIWLKGYVVVGDHHQLSLLSSVLNVELVNSKDSVQTFIKLPVTNGVTWGDIELPDTLKAGTYHLRAYTNYMRNAGDDYFFEKTLNIGNSVSNNVFTKVVYQANQQTINAAITYTNLDGQAYAHKEVSYDIVAANKTITKGKGITNADGVLNINFASAAINPDRINTTIKYNDKMVAAKTFPIQLAPNKVDVQFFPEGGYMVAGLRCKVGFKATGANGLGVNVKGVIKDSKNNEVAKLGEAHFGMGAVFFVPERGNTYSAEYTLPNGTVNHADLPAPMAEGITMAVFNTDPNTLFVKIYASQAIANKGNEEVNIVAQQNGKVYFAAKTKLNKASFTAPIPKSRFPTGIVQFTLFSATGEPMSERIVFVQNTDRLKLALSTEKKSYGPRQKVKIDLDARDTAGKQVAGIFSVSVIDETKMAVDEDDETTILSSLLLTSDLQGYIEKPNYYFNKPDDQARDNLDALMLTQGYRKFVWKQVLNDEFPLQKFQPEKSLSISGQVLTLSGKPVPKGKITLVSAAGGGFTLDTLTNDDGRFEFNNLIFFDHIQVTVQARDKNNGTNINLVLDKMPLVLTMHNRNANTVELNDDNNTMAYLQNSKKQFDDLVKFGLATKTTLLKEVVIKDSKKSEDQENDSFHGAFKADQTITAADMTKFVCMDEIWRCLEGKLIGVSFHGPGGAGIPYSNRTMNNSPVPMTILIDGVPLPPVSKLDDINPSTIAKIEVLRSLAKASIYGSIGGGGVILVTLNHGFIERPDQHYAPDVITYKPKGYYKAREFYAPRYDDPKTNASMLDLRTTIFWEPNLFTNEDGKTTFEFFNADSKGTYRVVVEGIDNEGNLARQVYRYKVE